MENSYYFTSKFEVWPAETTIVWTIDARICESMIPPDHDLFINGNLSFVLPLDDTSSNTIRFFVGKGKNPRFYGALCVRQERKEESGDSNSNVGMYISAKVTDSSNYTEVLFANKYIIIKGSSPTIVHNDFYEFDIFGKDTFELKIKFASSTNSTNSSLNQLSKQISPKHSYVNQVGSFFYSEDNFSDVVLVSADGMEHRAHKFLLAARSNRFLELFQETPGEKINLPDVNGKPLVALLHFIYTGEMHAEANRCMKGLLHAAIQYDLCGLLKILDKKLISICKKENMREVFELHQLAKDNFMPIATKQIAEFIKGNI